jgi:hypothetical protein
VIGTRECGFDIAVAKLLVVVLAVVVISLRKPSAPYTATVIDASGSPPVAATTRPLMRPPRWRSRSSPPRSWPGESTTNVDDSKESAWSKNSVAYAPVESNPRSL